MMVPVARRSFVLGYVMQRGLINPFITRPEHTQFMLLVRVAIILVNGLLMVFGPDAQRADILSLAIAVGALIVDATRLRRPAAWPWRRRCSPFSATR